jgi:hypothetical protein
MTEIVNEQQLSPNYVVDVTKPAHLAWWAAAFDVPEQALIEAVEFVGPQATEVFRYLQRDDAQRSETSAAHHASERRRSDRRSADRRATTLGFPDEIGADEAQIGSEQH